MIKVCKCKRCGHEWASKMETHLPYVCPKCKSPYWDKEMKANPNIKNRYQMALAQQ